jgi:hypothetical protein
MCLNKLVLLQVHLSPQNLNAQAQTNSQDDSHHNFFQPSQSFTIVNNILQINF